MLFHLNSLFSNCNKKNTEKFKYHERKKVKMKKIESNQSIFKRKKGAADGIKTANTEQFLHGQAITVTVIFVLRLVQLANLCCSMWMIQGDHNAFI